MNIKFHIKFHIIISFLLKNLIYKFAEKNYVKGKYFNFFFISPHVINMFTNRPAHEKGLLEEEPLSQLYEDLEQGLIDIDTFDKEAFSRRLDLTDISLIEGTYYFEYQTVNDYDGNTTLGRGMLTFTRDEKDYNNMILTGKAHIGKGTNYNKETMSDWNGTIDITTKEIKWDEKFETHRGVFKNTARCIDNNHWNGTYYWEIKPGARGKVTLYVYTFPNRQKKSARIQ